MCWSRSVFLEAVQAGASVKYLAKQAVKVACLKVVINQ